VDKEKLKEIKASRLRDARIAAGFKSLPEAVRHFKWNENTYKPHEVGSRAFDDLTAVQYALAYKVPLEHLLALDLLEPKLRKIDKSKHEAGGDLPLRSASIPIYGEAAGGIWRESDDVPLDDATSIPPDPDYASSIQYARKVVGNSVSRRIRDGEYAVILHFDQSPIALQPGRLVDVERVRSGLREHTIKVFAGDNKLMTDSEELSEQVELALAHSDEDTVVRIVGIVVGKYSQLV
jgi:hypothetical protein